MAESATFFSEEPQSKITCQATLTADELEFDIKYKGNTTWAHITQWHCEVLPPTFHLQIHNELLYAIRSLQKTFDGCLGVSLTSIRNRKQFWRFAIGHDTLDHAFQLATKFVDVKKTILSFVQKIDANVKVISLRSRVGKESGSSTQYNRDTDKSCMKSETIIYSPPGKTEVHESETKWFCKLEQDEFEIDLTSSHRTFTRLKKMFDNMYHCTLKRVKRGSLILVCGHDSQEDALDMVKDHVKVKATILQCLQEMDHRVGALKVEVEYRENGQDVDDLKQHVSYLRETLRRLKELERERMSESRMSTLVRPQPSDSSGLYLSTPETEGGYGYEGGVREEQETSGSVTDLRRRQTDIEQELKATTERLHSLEITRTRAPGTDPGREPGRRHNPQGSDQHCGAFSHPSEMEALRPGATQESELHVYSREEETLKSGTPLGPDTRATPTPARRDTEADSDLLVASRDGNMAAVKRILAAGRADVNCRDEGGRTPVMMAARRGNREVVELLVSGGADVSLVDGVGNNILHRACWGGDVETVKFVLSLNVVDINSIGDRSWTPVMAAAGGGHRDVVQLLVSGGADVSLVDGVGNNILHYACHGGDVETVKFVLSLHVVNIDARNNAGQTAADVARLGGHKKVVKLLQPPHCHVM